MALARLAANAVPAFALVALLGACATDYRAPVTKFRDAVAMTRDGVVTMEAGMGEIAAEIARNDYLNRAPGKARETTPRIDIPDDDCKTDSERCRVFITTGDDKTASVKVSRRIELPNTTAMVKAISAYADALVAIVESDNSETAKSSGEVALARAEKINGVAAKVLTDWEARELPAIIKAGADFLGFVIRQHLKRKRQEVLAEVVLEGHKVLGKLKPHIGKLSEQYGVATVARLAARVQASRQELELYRSRRNYDHTDHESRDHEGALFDRFVAGVHGLDEALQRRNTPVFRDLISAHEALRASLAKEREDQGMQEIMAFFDTATIFHEKAAIVKDALEREPNKG